LLLLCGAAVACCCLLLMLLLFLSVRSDAFRHQGSVAKVSDMRHFVAAKSVSRWLLMLLLLLLPPAACCCCSPLGLALNELHIEAI